MNTKTGLNSDRSPGGKPKTYDIARGSTSESQKLVPVKGLKGYMQEKNNPDIPLGDNIPDEIKYRR